MRLDHLDGKLCIDYEKGEYSGTNISPKQWSNLILELNLIFKQWAPYAKFEIQGPGVKKNH